MEIKPYRYSNRVPPKGLVVLTGAVLVIGIVYGTILFFISALFYMLFLFPVIVGVLGGNVVSRIIIKQKVRNLFVAGFFACLMAVVTYASFHYAGYIKFKLDLEDALNRRTEQIDPELRNNFEDFFLSEKTGRTGFPGYMEYQAQKGISFTSRSGENKTLFAGQQLWGYWLFELVTIMASSTYFALTYRRKPFCEHCGNWYGDSKHIGSIDMEDRDLVFDALRIGKLGLIPGFIIEGTGRVETIDIYLRRCNHCKAGEDVLTISENWINPRGHLLSKQLFEGIIPREQGDELL